MKIRRLFLTVAFVLISFSCIYYMNRITISANCRSSVAPTEEPKIEMVKNEINEIIKDIDAEREAIALLKNNLKSIPVEDDEAQKKFNELAFEIRRHWQALTYGFRLRKGIENRLKDLLAKVEKIEPNGQLKTKIQNQLNEVQELVNQIEALKEETKKQAEKRGLLYLEPMID